MSYEYDPHRIQVERTEPSLLQPALQQDWDPHVAPESDGKDFTTTARVRKVRPEHYLGYLDTA